MPALLIKIEAALGADLTDDPTAWFWTDISAYWRRAGGIAIQRGGANEFDTFQPSQLRFVLNNTDGRFTAANPSGPYYGQWGIGTPVRVSVNPLGSDVVRATCLVSKIELAWPTQRETVADVVITATGVLNRLAQG